MPYSLVLNLLPLSPISPGYLTGRHLHALFLTLVTAVDKDLGDFLHESYKDKAFTLSPLQISSPVSKTMKKGDKTLQWEHSKPIPTGTPCWWRISLLDESLFSKLSQLWLNLNPQFSWHLGSANLQISSLLGTPQPAQPWANASPYSQLYEEASETERIFSFTIATPAAFRQGKYDTALPTKDAIFNSLLKRWNKYSGIEFNELALEAIFPSFFEIRTEILTENRSKFIGCVGNISYRLLGEVEPEQIKQLNTLANFALYCGVGRKTPMGMGMVRRY